MLGIYRLSFALERQSKISGSSGRVINLDGNLGTFRKNERQHKSHIDGNQLDELKNVKVLYAILI
jgi:hypothetical protein